MSVVSSSTHLRDCGAEERRLREELAALYRLFHHYGWTDLIDTHLSARVPGTQDQYLINPYGLMFEEIRASDLIRVDFNGKVLAGDHPFNRAGHLIHTAVLKARPEIDFVLHSHTRAGVAVSAMACGVLPLSQHAGIVLGTVAYHDYQQVTRAEDECELLGRDLGDNYLMVLRNHGLLACGRTAAEAFFYHYFLEMACKIQVDVLAAGQDYVLPAGEAVAGLKAGGLPGDDPHGENYWPALMRLVERRYPDYRD